MQALETVLAGLRNPAAIPSATRRTLRRYTSHDVGVQGSYRTGNIGDRALGEIFESHLEREGYRTHLFDKNVQHSRAPNRILGGGGVLHDWYGTKHLRRRLRYANGGEKGFIIGVGAPGFQSAEARDLVQRVLPEMEVITVRDERSKRNIEKVCDADVIVTACPAFLYQDPDREVTNQTGVNFRPYFDEKADMSDAVLKQYFGYEDLENATERYVENAQTICEQLDDPLFIPFHPSDETFARKYLDVPIFEHEFSVERTLNKVSQMRRMVTTRYHSLIFAAICGKPVLPLMYEPKVEAVAERLEVPGYKPHKEVAFEFTAVSNVNSVRSAARRNMDLLNKHLH